MAEKPEKSDCERQDDVRVKPPGDHGVDLSLIAWMLELTPEERLRAAQDMIDTVWTLRNAEQSS